MKGLLCKLTETKTPARLRAEAMGFTFGNFEVLNSASRFDHYIFRGTFNCVCGRMEYFSVLCHGSDIECRYDWCATLEEIGAFSREHLLADGYSDDEVDAMMARSLTVDLTDAQMREAGVIA